MPRPYLSSDEEDAGDRVVDDGDDARMRDVEDDAEEVPVEDPTSTGDRLWNIPPPRGLKEISSLATWTVSTSKPGCGIQSLRAPDPSTYWQSDGPQPHHLNIHFFKLVRIVYMRFYVDAALDESYAPRKMHFLAGTGLHDLREVCTMVLEQPGGWIDVDMENVGGPPAFPEGDPIQYADDDQDMVRISENHQNGKDTHLRGLQIFARDEANGRQKTKPMNRSLNDRVKKGAAKNVLLGLKQPEWMGDPVLR